MKKCWVFLPCLWTALLFKYTESFHDDSLSGQYQKEYYSYESSSYEKKSEYLYSDEDNSDDRSSDEDNSCGKSQPFKGKNGYIFTCPRTLKTGACNEVQLRRFGDKEAGTLTIQVFYKESYNSNETLALEQTYEIEEGVKESYLDLCIESFENYVYDGKVVISGEFGDYNIGGSNPVYFRKSKDFIVFIQTDKPIYKPGQTVYFRILIVDTKLKPIKNAVADILVKDPKGTRLFQWKSVKPTKGIKQFDFPLANEPEQGNWEISVTVQEDVTTTRFEVKEYVLPKFDVTITTPPFVLTDAEEVPITICANYTYGEPVNGYLRMNISLQPYFYLSQEKTPVLEYEGEISGCFNYVINISLVDIDEFSYYRRIQIKANVEESGTGIERNATKTFNRQSYPLSLSFNRDQRQYFKPGLPYNGELVVNNPDNTPACDEDIQICFTVTKERVISTWSATKTVEVCKNYTSDEEGKISFIIPPQSTDSVRIELEALSLKYAKKNNQVNGDTPRNNSLNQPRTSTSLTPYFSPSGSFIQLQPVGETLMTGFRRFQLLFTAKKSGEYKFIYQVITPSGVVDSGKVKVWFSSEDDVSWRFDDQDKLITGKEIQIVPPANSTKPDDDCPAAGDEKYTPPVGEAYIELDINRSLSPNFRLLVYYVREDRETVADSEKFKVELSFKNRVKFQFKDAVKQPATETSFRLSSSPNSLCGIKVVDKSVSLLNNNDQLTKEKVFQFLDSLDVGTYYSVNHCADEIHQPGLPSASSKLAIIPLPPPPPYSSSEYVDALTAFETSGLFVISDLVLFTRPCKNSGSNGRFFHSSVGGIRAKSLKRNNAADMALPVAANSEVTATQSAVEVRSFFPETWLFELDYVGESGKLVKKERLPDTITDWEGSAVCINDEDGLGISNKTTIRGFQAFFLSLTLPYSVVRGEIFEITVTVFNYLEESLPITVYLDKVTGFEVISDSTSEDICVEPKEGKSLKIQLKAIALGEQTITVKAETAKSKSVCQGDQVSDVIAKDGVEKSLIVEAEGYPVEEVQTMLFCPDDEDDGVFKKIYSIKVPDSNYVNDSARSYFDVTGNILGKGLDNLQNLITLPSGCGEQNMAKLAPNVVAIRLLTAINQLTEKIKTKIINYLSTGVQNQLKYRRPDGSFSAFGNRDKEGSMFLTAFVLRYFSQAQEFIFIDNSTVDQMQKWIVSKQQANGCFKDVGRIFDSGLQGGIKEDDSLVTCYAFSSLYISGYKNQTVMESALSCCIAESEGKSFYVCATFLSTYAEALNGDTDSAKERNSAAKEEATIEEGVEYYHDTNATKSQDLETTAYAALSMLKTGRSASSVLAIIQYLAQNLSPRGGFLSTQDTCVGFEAFAEFAKLTFKDSVDITITLNGGGLKKKIDVTEDNKLLVQRNQVPQVPSKVTMKATGTGCALIQNILRYNTETPVEKRNFKIIVESKCLEDECKKATITISVSFLPKGGKTGMALVQVKMISGVVPIRESLDKLYGDPNLQLMRYDVENNIVVFYFLQITNDVKRFSFEVQVVAVVENPFPGFVKAFDYYNEAISSNTNYTLSE